MAPIPITFGLFRKAVIVVLNRRVTKCGGGQCQKQAHEREKFDGAVHVYKFKLHGCASIVKDLFLALLGGGLREKSFTAGGAACKLGGVSGQLIENGQVSAPPTRV